MAESTTLISIRILESINSELRRRVEERRPAPPRWPPLKVLQLTTASVSIGLLLATVSFLVTA